ncbi:MAG: hypothetical protein M3Z05_04750 [Gemmatimonadota bacterium]|nr:hypothetical protein [Gemmatimonadota bacterium]
MRTSTALSLAILVPLLLTHRAGAQSAPTVRDTTIREFRGAYQRGFEQSWFAACGAASDDRQWWVTLTDQALAERDSILATLPRIKPSDGLYVRWKGRVGKRMPAGMMGIGTRYVLVTEVLEIRATPGGDPCSLERSS